MSNIVRFKVCLNCIACIPIITESDFSEIEKSFDNIHKNHLTTILTVKEMFLFAEKQDVIKKIRKNDKTLRNLKVFIDIPTKSEKNYIDKLKNDNKRLKRRLKQLKNNTLSFDDVLNAQLQIKKNKRF